MAKRKKKTLDDLDLEILAALYCSGAATATDLEAKIKNLTKAGISKRLKWLVEAGYLEEPEIDISTGKLKKIYKAPSREELKKYFLEWFVVEVYEPVIDEFLSEEEAEETREKEPPEKAIEKNIAVELGFLSPADISELIEGVDINKALEMFDEYYEVARLDVFGFITLKNGKVKLTEKGLDAVLNEWVEKLEDLKDLIEGLKELGSKSEKFRRAYEKFKTEVCKS